MSWRCEREAGWARTLAIAAVAISMSASGCYITQDPPDEICNYLDDDRNGLADDPFVDETGRYHTKAHCGSCNVSCDAAFPSASETACDLGDLASDFPRCVIESCPEGTHLPADPFACVPDLEVQCAACEDDLDCSLGDPTAACFVMAAGDGRCLLSCAGAPSSCDDGFDCVALETDGQLEMMCVPSSGRCECTPDQAGATYGCLLESPSGDQLCPGSQECDGFALTPCTAQLEDLCDGADNDCDGTIDADFMVDGQYVDDAHCGACNNPCVPPAANMAASCALVDDSPTCLYECLPGFVDVDGVSLNGCECEMTAADWPPSALGVDGDCDGTLDDLTGYVFVSKNGDDANPGTLEAPVLTIDRGIALATPAGKTVVAAQGTYDERVTLAAGVSLVGGYRFDFGARDVELFETVIHHTSGLPGRPALVARDISTETRVVGLTVIGTDAAGWGAGSTAVLLDGCSAALELWDLEVHAGDGADGADGRSSSSILSSLGVPSPSFLGGSPGLDGGGGIDAYSFSCFAKWVAGGGAGQKTCPVSGTVVSGGAGGDSSCPSTGCAIGQPCGNAGCSDFTVGGVCDFDAVYASAIPNPPAQDGHGPDPGGGGVQTYDAPTTLAGVTFCDDNPTLPREGGPGEDGGDGEDGQGGDGFDAPAGIFDSTFATWRGGDGTGGTDGTDGSGGGGGTQGNGYDRLPGASSTYYDHLGGAGGGGGAGGCGAPGAEGGQGGGGSIAIAVFLDATNGGPTIHEFDVFPGRAGDGGDGGVGLAGGAPGAGGDGGDGNFWCARRGGKGGDGGRGGAGGGGGGGAGGSISGFHVIPGQPGFVSLYLMGLTIANTIYALPAPGTGGSGGYAPGASGTAGIAGTAVATRLYDPD